MEEAAPAAHTARVLGLPRATALREGASTVTERTARGWTVLSAGSTFGAEGSAEEFEQRVQRLVREGHRRLVADLHSLTNVDDSGISTLLRCQAAVERSGGTFRTVATRPELVRALAEAGLERVLAPVDSVESATTRAVAWNDLALGGSVLLVTGTLVALGRAGGTGLDQARTAGEVVRTSGPVAELVQLVAAALVGFLVTAVQKRQQRDRPMTRSLEQAQVLLCVSGALMMIIIGSSLARAFGIAGAAGIIRFRTPVDDPKDVTILFLLMGLGMACGIGALPVAGLGTLFLCAGLVVLDRVIVTKPRTMHVEIAAVGRDFPAPAVAAVFARYGVAIEPREITQEDETVVTYAAAVPPGTPIEHVTASLARSSPHVKSVAWAAPKRS